MLHATLLRMNSQPILCHLFCHCLLLTINIYRRRTKTKRYTYYNEKISRIHLLLQHKVFKEVSKYYTKKKKKSST